MRKILFIFLILICCNNTCLSMSTSADDDFIDEKIKLDEIFYKASTESKISTKDKRYINNLKQSVDTQKKSGNTALVPIYYKLGNIYRAVGMEDEAKSCYKTVIKYFNTPALSKKSRQILNGMGATEKDENGRTYVPLDKED